MESNLESVKQLVFKMDLVLTALTKNTTKIIMLEVIGFQ